MEPGIRFDKHGIRFEILASLYKSNSKEKESTTELFRGLTYVNSDQHEFFNL